MLHSSSKISGPRERMQWVGAHALSDSELVAILIGTGTRGKPSTLVAAELLENTGGLKFLCQLGANALSQSAGIGFGKACRIIAAIELGKRTNCATFQPGQTIQSSADAFKLLHHRMARLPYEEFVALPMDIKNGCLGLLQLGKGGGQSCVVQPRDVFRALIQQGASAVVLAHNHPSGDCQPSQQDLEFTQKLSTAGKLLGVPVFDHLVIGANNYFSFADAHLIK